MPPVTPPTTRDWRSFGWIVGGIFSVIGLWPLVFRQEPLRLWAVILGGFLLASGTLFPQILKGPYWLWMQLGHGLGWINARLILGAFFYGIFTPLGLVMRCFGRDTLKRRLDRSLASYRQKMKRPENPSMDRQF